MYASGLFGTIYNMDALDYLETCKPVRTMFADPPDNLGLMYNQYQDKIPPSKYYTWLETLVKKMMTKSEICWLSFHHTHLMEVMARLRYQLLGWSWRLIIWRYRFGQHRVSDMTNDYRPILLLRHWETDLLWDEVPVISERMLLGDPRAAGFKPVDDVWEFPRVVGNSAERQAWHPTQHPEELMKRIMLLSGHDFTDLFGGSGTTLRVAKSLQRPVNIVELDPYYCKKMAEFL